MQVKEMKNINQQQQMLMMKSCQMSPHISVTSISLPTNYETISKNTGKCNKPLTNTVQDGSLSIGKDGSDNNDFPTRS